MKFNFEQKIDLYKDGFEDKRNDLLQRRKTGKALSSLLNGIEDPLVIALDSQWGSGKTYFLKRWVGQHLKENNDQTVLYFDAFSHDYISDPLPALVTALEGRTKNKNIKKLQNAVFNLAKAGTRAGVAVATSGVSEAFGKVGEGITKALGDQAEKSLEEYWKREEGRSIAMEQFRAALESMVLAEKNNKVIIVVDELDRCRPDYALEVLEVIKHFFSVDNVHFVLGVNLEVLENMIGVRYGNEIDANAYLQKFIQIKLELPDEVEHPAHQNWDVSLYLDRLLEQLKIPEHVGRPLKFQIKIVARNNSINLRQIEQIVSAVKLANNFYLTNENIRPGWFDVMNDLIISRIVRPDLYPKFLDATIAPEDLKSYLGTNDNELGRERDPGYNSRASSSFYSWLYITENERFNDANGNLRDIIPNYTFSRYSFLFPDISPRDIPQKIQREWLDLLQFYKPDSEINQNNKQP
ncbi:MAG: P-loop NTPase fold protein [Rhodobacteraceae bacterium]|nr:P-loop NTPase fold protein [Paracoccaceae bacterium]